MNLSLFLAFIFLSTFVFGKLLEKIRVPWVFSALFIGFFLSINNPFQEITSSDSFKFLADLGMYFLLFIIGFDLNLKEVLKQKKFVFKLTFLMILGEAFFGAIIIHNIFHIAWPIAILTATSFATVGEAVLIPILDEFKIIKTKFGQILLGIGTLDDIVELITIIAAIILIGNSLGVSSTSLLITIPIFITLFFLPFLLSLIKKIHIFKFKGISSLFLFSLFIIFVFIGIGQFVEAASLGAILAGLALKSFLNQKQGEHLEQIIRTISYGFLVPIFFMSVGVETNLKYILTTPLIILLILLTTNTVKIFSSYLLGKKYLGSKKAVLLGIGLSAKFSTSIVIITLLFNKNLIPNTLYSTLIGAMAISKFIIPVLFSTLIQKWKLNFK